MPNEALSGRTYLVVEDEYLVASDMQTMLESAGARVFGPVSDVRQAMEVLSEPSLEIDAAVLDINLHGEMVYPAAALLARRGTPFIFVTGYDCAAMPKEFSAAPCLSKPTVEADLIAALSEISSTRDLGLAAEQM
ncbi:CheY-like chemotaxis protein [Neorhizobium huautlense]|uniref:CheY-like chemotaxis protein n=1 Tax=Neorhizobium huautlense TaxID=67774 RepID=A0ABT9Q126_9HYPH|nr:response regulator [Neorhizobium huautlense]MDP9840404.1 CheY-like chemotaxis protein [Neorhizobium huautlense]